MEYLSCFTSGFNIYLLELLALYFASAFSIILLGPGMFSIDYLIKEILKSKPDIFNSILSQNQTVKSIPSSNGELNKSFKNKKSFDFSPIEHNLSHD